MRSRYVFVQGQPRRTLGEPLAPDHRLVLVRDGLALGGGRPPAPDPPRVEREPADRWHGVLTASEVDQVTVLGLNYPARYVQGWRTECPPTTSWSGRAASCLRSWPRTSGGSATSWTAGPSCCSSPDGAAATAQRTS